MKVQIDLKDVVSAGSVAMAINAWAHGTENTAASSGTAAAVTAFNEGSMVYIDTNDGRACHQVPCDPDTEGCLMDIGGQYYTIGDWTEDSVVCIDVPTIDDALEHPDFVRSMWVSMRSYHYACSDFLAWKELMDELKKIEGAVQTLRAYSPMITGDNIADTAHAWLDAGIEDDGSIDSWCDVGCWCPKTAAVWSKAGLSPEDVVRAVADIEDKISQDDMHARFSGGLIYACCNGDYSAKKVIEMHKMIVSE